MPAVTTMSDRISNMEQDIIYLNKQVLVLQLKHNKLIEDTLNLVDKLDKKIMVYLEVGG